jgi:hypothetical protein
LTIINCYYDLQLFDTEKRQYLTSKVNSLFSLKHYFIVTSGDKKEKLLTENDDESSVVMEEGLFYDPYWVAVQRKSPASACIIKEDYSLRS